MLSPDTINTPAIRDQRPQPIAILESPEHEQRNDTNMNFDDFVLQEEGIALSLVELEEGNGKMEDIDKMVKASRQKK